MDQSAKLGLTEGRKLVMKRKKVLISMVFLATIAIVIGSSCSSAKESAKFASNAATGGMAEVELGKLAVEKGADPAVKEFGQRMIADHTRANTELKAVAAKKEKSEAELIRQATHNLLRAVKRRLAKRLARG